MAQPRRARRQPNPPGKPQLLSQVAADTLATFLFVLGQAATVEVSCCEESRDSALTPVSTFPVHSSSSCTTR